MAHNVNYRMKDYNKIYTDILNITQNDDLTFCNLETPVDGTIPYETYPTFNVQPPYLQAAVDAGFEVFSLANNHTNDQNGHGITETYKNFDTLRNNLEYKVYFSGIRENKNKGMENSFLWNYRMYKCLSRYGIDRLRSTYY